LKTSNRPVSNFTTFHIILKKAGQFFSCGPAWQKGKKVDLTANRPVFAGLS
jgi:hypothetical protein